jgi:hypothetical protein
MTDNEKLKAIMKELNINFFDIADITGLAYNTVKTSLQPNRPVPRWVKFLLYAWENKKH